MVDAFHVKSVSTLSKTFQINLQPSKTQFPSPVAPNVGNVVDGAAWPLFECAAGA